MPQLNLNTLASQTSSGMASFTRLLIGIVLTALVLLFLWLTLKMDLILFGGLLLAAFLRTASHRVGVITGLTVAWSLVAVVLSITVTILALLWLSATTLTGQIGELSQRLPQDFAHILQSVSHTPTGQQLTADFSAQNPRQNAQL